MIHPRVLVSVDGVPVSGAFFENLTSLTITDREGIQSDTVELVFNDAPPHFASPRQGAVISVSILTGTGAGFVGTYVIDQVEYSCLPYTISVGGHSADLRAQMKTSKTRHWDNSDVKTIVTRIAGEYGLEPKISQTVAAHVYEWIGQQGESDLNFLERLARRHGALFTIKNGALLWLERGMGQTATGAAIPPVRIVAPDIVTGTCRISQTDVERFATVKACWQDRGGATRREVVVKADPGASGEHVLRDPYGSREEAEAAARAAAREMIRGQITTSCTLAGRPSLMAGLPLIYSGVRPGIDGLAFLIDTVTHSFTKSSGLCTSFSAKLQIGGDQNG